MWSDVVLCAPMWSHVVRCGPMLSDVVISQTRRAVLLTACLEILRYSLSGNAASQLVR